MRWRLSARWHWNGTDKSFGLRECLVQFFGANQSVFVPGDKLQKIDMRISKVVPLRLRLQLGEDAGTDRSHSGQEGNDPRVTVLPKREHRGDRRRDNASYHTRIIREAPVS
jgi:hypothetical protein